MLNDVTFGQFYPAKSFVHNMDARAKIVFVIAYIVAIFLADNFIALGAVTLFPACLSAACCARSR